MNLSDTAFDLNQFAERLSNELNNGLPGFDAQKKMSPSIREHSLKKNDPSTAKDSSVLLLLYPKNNRLYLPFIKRTSGGISHSGQISLPGGKFEEEDLNRTMTAIRETNEELGVDYKKIKVLGFLTELYIPVSNFMVLPVLGYCSQRPDFKINSFEVEEVIEIPLQHFFSTENISEFSFTKNNFEINAPYFDAKGHKVWGATAMILSELREIFLRGGLIF